MNKSDLDSQRDTSKLPLSWLTSFIRRLSIGRKIGYGYSLAIGIAVLGTTVGMALGEDYQKQAYEQLEIAHDQEYLLRTLEKAVVALRSHPPRLVSVLGKTILFEYESTKFLLEVTQFKALLNELESFADSHPRDLAVDASEFKDLLKGYETNTELYAVSIESLWQQIDPASLKTEEISAARQQVLVATSGEKAIKIDFQFERLAESLNRILAASENRERQATATLKRAEALRRQIILASMLLSAAFAAALALYTSRAIARPLEWVTKVAKQVTQDANFHLIAPVTTEDEVGSLASSLNQLVQWVGEYTNQLKQAHQTLEQRVEERTQELTQALQELKLTQAQLIQTEKMSSLGQMVAGIAHEINNPVNFIHGNLDYANNYTQDLLELVHLYQQEYPNPTPAIQDQLESLDLEFLAEDLPKLLDSMKMGTQRIRQIILSLRNFSRLDESDMKQVDIHEGIDSTLLILNNRLKKGIEVIKQYGELPKVECYPAGLNQVFMNILANAIDALEESGAHNTEKELPPETRITGVADSSFRWFGCTDRRIPANSCSGTSGSRTGSSASSFIEVTEVPSGVQSKKGTPQILIQTSMVDSNHIRVGIRDNGPGITPEIRDKLFDPFFTTKQVGKGTGLGLSICYQIIEKHKGKIEVISESGQGTEFAIALPVNGKFKITT